MIQLIRPDGHLGSRVVPPALTDSPEGGRAPWPRTERCRTSTPEVHDITPRELRRKTPLGQNVHCGVPIAPLSHEVDAIDMPPRATAIGMRNGVGLGDLIKVLWWDGDGLCLFAKRLERGRFVWPQATEGTVALTRAQLSMLLEGIDWRRPLRTAVPQMAV